MLSNSIPLSQEEIETSLSNTKVQKVTLRRVLPKSVILSLHQDAFNKSVRLATTHKAIQTYTTQPVIDDKYLDLLRIIFSSNTLSKTSITKIAKDSNLLENTIQKLSTSLPPNVKKQMSSTIEKLLLFGQSSSRELPAFALKYAQKMVNNDLHLQEEKLNQEIANFFEAVNLGKIIRFGIMLDVITSHAHPFCFLNKVKYEFSDGLYSSFIECYVLFYAEKIFDEKHNLSSLAVWLQLHPIYSEELNRMPSSPITSEVKYVNYPEGLVLFQFADIAIQVELSSLQHSNLLDVKPKNELIKDMKEFVRTMKAPGIKKKGGIALHVTFTKHLDRSTDPNARNMWV
ncbi:MAG: hypothetical protein KAH84_00310 [Thiomargarita sp.]|nr:hypothetical protein [Thiomargarita sp.]